ncbi:MAG TPA: pitrilysin family protein [Kofleriaceae bacterium]|nr:pitrilysin family protein [Kofleriaceae bacterium]
MTAPFSFDAAGDPHLTCECRTLPCGLDVIVHRDDTAPQVHASVWYRAGSSDEPPHRSGLAHLFEHLFKNSQHMPSAHYDVLRRAGATDANASTSTDRTAYHETVPAHELPLALWLEADRMGYVLPGLTAERLAKQQSVVRAERRQRYESVPYGAERLAIAEALYPEGHPHRHLTIGLHEHIQAATLGDVEAFYRTWYVPANACLVLAGDVGEGERIWELVDGYFGSFPASRRPPRAQVAAPELAAPVHVRVDDHFAVLARIHRAWHAPAAFAPGEPELAILAQAWCAVGTGPLWRRLVYERRLAQRVSAWTVGARLGGEVHVAVDAMPGADLGEIRAILDDECERGPDAAAIARAVTRDEASAIWALTALPRRASLAQRYALYTGDPDGLAADLVRQRAVTPESVAVALRGWLAPARTVEVETVPRARESAPA